MGAVLGGEGVAEDQLAADSLPRRYAACLSVVPLEQDRHRRSAAGCVHPHGPAEGERHLHRLACLEDPVVARVVEGGYAGDGHGLGLHPGLHPGPRTLKEPVSQDGRFPGRHAGYEAAHRVLARRPIPDLGGQRFLIDVNPGVGCAALVLNGRGKHRGGRRRRRWCIRPQYWGRPGSHIADADAVGGFQWRVRQAA